MNFFSQLLYFSALQSPLGSFIWILESPFLSTTFPPEYGLNSLFLSVSYNGCVKRKILGNILQHPRTLFYFSKAHCIVGFCCVCFFVLVPYFLDYKTHFPPQIWEEMGVHLIIQISLTWLSGGGGGGGGAGFFFPIFLL